jgi:hypothetical protein
MLYTTVACKEKRIACIGLIFPYLLFRYAIDLTYCLNIQALHWRHTTCKAFLYIDRSQTLIDNLASRFFIVMVDCFKRFIDQG